jgi:hypothetical protein
MVSVVPLGVVVGPAAIVVTARIAIPRAIVEGKASPLVAEPGTVVVPRRARGGIRVVSAVGVDLNTKINWLNLRGRLQSHLRERFILFHPTLLAQIAPNVFIRLHSPPKFGAKNL